MGPEKGLAQTQNHLRADDLERAGSLTAEACYLARSTMSPTKSALTNAITAT